MPNTLKEPQKEKESLAEQTIKRFRGADYAEKSAKRKKSARVLVVVNLVLVVVLLMFFVSQKPKDEYLTSSLKYKDIQMRFSKSTDTETGNLYFSLTFTSQSKINVDLRFKERVADLIITCNNYMITKKSIGDSTTDIFLKPGESKTLVELVDINLLNDFAMNHVEKTDSNRKSLLPMTKKRMPVMAEIVLNNEERLSTSLSFQHEVK